MKTKAFLRTGVLALAAALVFCSCGGGTSSEAPQPTEQPTAQPVIGEGGTMACVGDSITYGLGVNKTRDTDAWPAVLQSLLGEAWEVENFGNPGSTLLDDSNRPYREQKQYPASLEMAADVYLIMLGGNDAKEEFWDAAAYKEQYQQLIESYREANPDALIYLMLSPTIYPQDTDNPEYYTVMGDTVHNEVIDCVKEVAEQAGLPVIDLHSFTADHPEWYADGVHPNKTGNSAVAQYIYYALTGTEGEIVLEPESVLPEGTTIGCVGDSTTYGSGVMKTRDTESYPALLQGLLGEGVSVSNFGMGSQTVMPGTDAPYREHSIYRKSIKEPADFYIIMMGTNDAKNIYWDAESFHDELCDFVQGYQALDSQPRIILMTPVTVYVVEGNEEVNFDINAAYLDEAAAIVADVAEEMELPLIDIHALTADHPEWFADGVHPNLEGNTAIAQAVFDALEEAA